MSAENYNIHKAKTQLSRLVQEAAEGKEIIICKAGKPMARLVPLADTLGGERTPGGLEGQIIVSDDFDQTPESIIDQFEGPR